MDERDVVSLLSHEQLNSNKSPLPLDELPCEILFIILDHLTLRELAILRSICKRLKFLAEERIKKITHLKVNPKDGLFPLTSVVLFDSTQVAKVTIEDSKPEILDQLCIFLSKYCTELVALDAPDCSIGISSLQELAKSLKYFCIYSPGGYGSNSVVFGDIAARTLTQLMAFDFIDKKNVLKASLFYHRKMGSGMGNFVQWQHLLGMNNSFIPPNIRSLTTSIVSPESIRSIHERAGQTLEFLDLQFSFEYNDEFNGTSFHFPNLISVILRNFSKKFLWFLEIVTKSSNLKSLYILGKFSISTVARMIEPCDNLKYLALIYKSRSDSKPKEQFSTFAIFNSKLNLIELLYPTPFVIAEANCNKLRFLDIGDHIIDLPDSMLTSLQELKLNEISNDFWSKLNQFIPRMNYLKCLHIDSTVKEESFFINFTSNLQKLLKQLNQLDLKLRSHGQFETIEITIDLPSLPHLKRMNLDVPLVNWNIKIPRNWNVFEETFLRIENGTNCIVSVSGNYKLTY